jgi:hypothetical protein
MCKKGKRKGRENGCMEDIVDGKVWSKKKKKKEEKNKNKFNCQETDDNSY